MYLTTSDVAGEFGVLPSTVRRWVSAGTISPTVTTPGGQYKFSRESVDQLKADTAASKAVAS
ncbi:helix-turn-helix domain-containing protein [Tersicoccus sp. Bi-70]|uniref:helix-turn-helix domain-containing protein n=1 Tax=Tersicoccus sp. Bi-70 TaxID=1897634 RepID=UPI000977BD0A|nr:helix-turn-helix domain-containing protein [Tersicoccus sp. Bi-70]